LAAVALEAPMLLLEQAVMTPYLAPLHRLVAAAVALATEAQIQMVLTVARVVVPGMIL
jgi:hypothetical protein